MFGRQTIIIPRSMTQRPEQWHNGENDADVGIKRAALKPPTAPFLSSPCCCSTRHSTTNSNNKSLNTTDSLGRHPPENNTKQQEQEPTNSHSWLQTRASPEFNQKKKNAFCSFFLLTKPTQQHQHRTLLANQANQHNKTTNNTTTYI